MNLGIVLPVEHPGPSALGDAILPFHLECTEGGSARFQNTKARDRSLFEPGCPILNTHAEQIGNFLSALLSKTPGQ